jgi:putative FmdB family regulatory protein
MKRRPGGAAEPRIRLAQPRGPGWRGQRGLTLCRDVVKKRGSEEGAAVPIYEFVCEECGAEFEYLVLGSSDAPACKRCQSRKAKRKLSVFSHKSGSTFRSSTGPSCTGCTSSSCSSCKS